MEKMKINKKTLSPTQMELNRKKALSPACMELNGKKALSPVIATVILVAIVIVIGLIIFLWFKGMGEEAITKFDDKNVKLICQDDVKFDSEYSGGELYISNIGNTPIYGMKMQVFTPGGHETYDLKEYGYPEAGLNQGGIYTEDLSLVISGAEKILLIPILIGDSDKGQKTHQCDEMYGEEIII